MVPLSYDIFNISQFMTKYFLNIKSTMFEVESFACVILQIVFSCVQPLTSIIEGVFL